MAGLQGVASTGNAWIPNAISSGSLAPGGTATGNVVLEAPRGDPNIKLADTPVGPRQESATVNLQ